MLFVAQHAKSIKIDAERVRWRVIPLGRSSSKYLKVAASAVQNIKGNIKHKYITVICIFRLLTNVQHRHLREFSRH